MDFIEWDGANEVYIEFIGLADNMLRSNKFVIGCIEGKDIIKWVDIFGGNGSEIEVTIIRSRKTIFVTERVEVLKIRSELPSL